MGGVGTAGEAIAEPGPDGGEAADDDWLTPNQAFTRSPLLSQCDCRIVESQCPAARLAAGKAFDRIPELA